TDANAVAHRSSARLDQIQEAVPGIDDNRAGRLARRIADALAIIFRVHLSKRHSWQVMPPVIERSIACFQFRFRCNPDGLAWHVGELRPLAWVRGGTGRKYNR